MVRILGSMITKNEAGRYLDSCLAWNRHLLDELFVYDDQSNDDTVDICLRYTDVITRRRDTDPTWMAHEGKFRQAAYEMLIERLQPQEGDWILSLDADEYVVGSHEGFHTREELEMLIAAAEETGKTSVNIHIPEAWSFVPTIQVRKDGYWGDIRNPTRLFKYIPGQTEFMPKAMGCGSGPRYAWRNQLETMHMVRILHVGYALEEERQARYERYTSLPDHGHNVKHINSIIANPQLQPWQGQMPKIWRGNSHGPVDYHPVA